MNLLFAAYHPLSKKENTANPIRFELVASQKSGQFSTTHPVQYQLIVSNKSKINQEGVFKYEVRYNDFDVISKSFDVKIAVGGSLKSTIQIPVEYTGNYDVIFHLDLINYSENIKESFGYIGEKGSMETAFKNGYSSNPKSKRLPMNYSTEAMVSSKEPIMEPEPVEGEIITTVKPYSEDGTYNKSEKIMYDVDFKSTYNISQTGELSYQILDDKGKVVFEQKKPIKLKRKGFESLTLKLPNPASAGVYKMRLCLNLSAYDDTTLYAFGYNIADIKTPYHRPPDFDAFWESTLAELASVDPEYKITESVEYSDAEFNVYRVDMKSYQSIPIYGWLSIPKAKGKYPLIVGYGAYLRTITPEFFHNYACFMLNVRGVDPAVMEMINPEKKELFVLGIESKETYVYRGIYMDCIRAMDFLVSHAKEFNFDMDRVAVYGGSQGGTLALVTAAILKKINTVSADSPVYCDFYNTLDIIATEKNPCYILRDLNNLPEYHPAFARENILQTLSYFEVQNFIPAIECSVLIGTGLMDMIAPPTTVIAAFNKMKKSVIAKSELYTYPTYTHEVPTKHYFIRGNWFDEELTPRRAKSGLGIFNK
jgi:cephalosporin-C deacetylase-like acetyl esterase